MKEQDKATTKDLNETDISNIPDSIFKAMIIRILTGLEKRVEDMSENFNTEIRNNVAEIKGSISEMNNTFNGTNSRWKKQRNEFVT